MYYNRTVMPQKIILNELASSSEGKLIEIGLPFIYGIPEINNIEIREFLYYTIIENYGWSEIIFDTAEQFSFWFQTYWNKAIPKYLPLFQAQIQNIINATTDTKETRGGEMVTTNSGSDLENINHGKILTHERELTETETPNVSITENNERTQYEEQTVNESSTTTPSGTNTRSLGGSYSNKNSGQDSTSTQYGKIVTIKDTRTNELKQFNYDKILQMLNSVSVLDSFIDCFKNLFVEVLYAQ